MPVELDYELDRLSVARTTDLQSTINLANGALGSANIFPNTTEGLAATTSGQYFSVPSAESAEFLILYRNNAGVADDTGKRYPSGQAVRDIGMETQAEDVSGLSFAVVDDANRRTWLEADLSGKPTDRAIALIGEKLSQEDAPVFFEEVVTAATENTGFATSSDEVNDLSFAVVDDANRRTWLEADKAGKPTDRAAALFAEKLPDNMVVKQYSAVGKVGTFNIVSGPDIVCWGDSMTAGTGGGGTTYPSVLGSLLSAVGYSGTVRNMGVGGETSVTITARAGGNPFMMIPVGGSIPASGSVEVILQAIDGYVPAPLKQGAASYTGYLGEIHGTFSRTVSNDVYTYYFTRTTAGDAVTLNRPTPFYLDVANERRGDIAILWIGQNGPNNTRAIQDAKAIVRRMRALEKRFLVISKPGGSSSQDADDVAWFAEFGRLFIPIRQYMVKYGLEDAGITPTAQDLTDIAAGTVPTSLRVDSVHWTAAGYTILANLIYQRLKELEWT